MWRSITITLLFLVLAQTANATAFSQINSNTSSNINAVVNLADNSHTAQVDNKSTSFTDDIEQKDNFNFPRLHRANASFFSTEVQTSPNYQLEIEFFAASLNAGLFKNLTNPPSTPSWYERLHSHQSSRLSGWKDSNTLYTTLAICHA